MGHFSFGLFLLDFVVCSEPLSQSRLAWIVMILPLWLSSSTRPFFCFCDTSRSFHRVPSTAASPSCHRCCLPFLALTLSFWVFLLLPPLLCPFLLVPAPAWQPETNQHVVAIYRRQLFPLQSISTWHCTIWSFQYLTTPTDLPFFLEV